MPAAAACAAFRSAPSASRRHSVRFASVFIVRLPRRGYLAHGTEEERMKIEGGCLCGKVRYSADAEPAFVGVCHCGNCQKASGTAFRVVLAVPKPALSVEGTLKTFNDRGDSG